MKQRKVESSVDLSLSNLPIDRATAEEALERKFTLGQLENMCDYVVQRTLYRRHGEMAGMCMEIDDDDGESHHNTMSSEAQRAFDAAATKLKRAGVAIRFVKVSAKWNRRWIFKNQHEKRFELAEGDVDLS